MTEIDIEQIDSNPRQPRSLFREIEELAESIRRHGLLEPVMVRPVGDRYETVHGERRIRAARLAGLKCVTAVVREVSDEESFEIAVVENIARDSLTPLEEAEAFEALAKAGRNQKAIAESIGRTQSYVAQKLRLLKAPDPLTWHLRHGELSENHVRQVLRLRRLHLANAESVFVPNAIPEAIESMRNGNGAEDARILLVRLRPLDHAPFPFFEPSPITVSGCCRFLEYVAEHNGRVPQWVASGFWWCSAAADTGVSVADLTRLLRQWEDIYQSAVAMFLRDGGLGCPKDFYHGYWADLRQSGSYGLEPTDDEFVRAVRNVLSNGMTGPSEFQYGPKRNDLLDETEPFERCNRDDDEWPKQVRLIDLDSARSAIDSIGKALEESESLPPMKQLSVLAQVREACLKLGNMLAEERLGIEREAGSLLKDTECAEARRKSESEEVERA